jgi:S1-C subfamily serine protease
MKSFLLALTLALTACGPTYYIKHGRVEFFTPDAEAARITRDIHDPSYRLASTKGGTASGVVIGHDDTYTYLLTNAHVAEVGEEFVVTRGDKTYAAGVGIRSDRVRDLAIVRTPRFPSALALLAELDDMPGLRFARVLVYGFPLGQESGHLTEGRISEPCDETGRMKLSAPIIYGNSGGGAFVLMSGRYRLVGLVQSIAVIKPVPIPHIAWACPLNEIRAFLSEPL